MMSFFSPGLVKDSPCVFDSCLIKFEQGFLLGIYLCLYSSKDYKGQASQIQSQFVFCDLL